MKWSADENGRYSRHFLLNEIGEEGQLKLKQSRVLVIGAGGLGCPALLYLATSGVGTIGVADFDTVELSNLHRQFLFTAADIGKQKAEAAAQAIKKLNPNIHTFIISEKITNKNALDIFSEYDLIIDGSDNFETRYIVNDACVLLNKVFIYGAVQKFEGQVAVFNFPVQNGKRSATYRCLHPNAPAAGAILNCSEEGVLGIIPGLTGTMQAVEALKIITGTGVPLAGKLLMFQALTMEFNTLHITRNEQLWKNFPSTEADFRKMDYTLFCSAKAIHESVKSITVKELQNLLNGNINLQLLDVRNYHETPDLNIENSIRIPLNELAERSNEISREIPVVVICASGERSRIASELLISRFNRANVRDLTGGIKAWLFEKQVK